MAIIMKSSIKITKGFDTWQAMVKAQEDRINEMGIKFLFAGTEKDDPTQLHAIMLFPSMEILQAFGANEELTEIRREAGAVIESGVMTLISEDYFTNYPDAVINQPPRWGTWGAPLHPRPTGHACDYSTFLFNN